MLSDVDNGQQTKAQCWMITAISWVTSTAATSVSYLTRTNGSTAYNGIVSVVKETKGPTIALSSNRQTLTITWPSSNGGTYSIVPLL